MRRVGSVVEKRRLADAGLAPHHQRGTQPIASGVEDATQGLPLDKPIHERHGRSKATRIVRGRLLDNPREVRTGN
jgi:hypothetical protein